MLNEIFLLLFFEFVKADGGSGEVASWWIYVVVVMMVIGAAAAVTFCCCGCFGKGTCCSDNEDEDMEKNSVHENVVMSEINDNQYINFNNPDEKPNKDDIEDLEEGKEIVEYEWGKDDGSIPAPYAL